MWRVQFERSTDGGKSWQVIGPVNEGHAIQAIQPSILIHPEKHLQALGSTSQAESPFLAISSGQRFTLKRLKEGPLLLCSFTEMRVKKDNFGRVIGGKTLNERVGMKIPAPGGNEVTVHGLFAALSFDDGKTWPVRRLVTPGGAPRLQDGIDGGKFTLSDTEAEPSGYLAMAQDPAGAIHLISSRNYYCFN